jgi:methyl-accepting chemotaxis protein
MQRGKGVFDISIRNFIYGILIIVFLGASFFTAFVFISSRTLVNGGKFVDYVGKVRGGMQRASKFALSGHDPDEAMQRVEEILKIVTEGSKEEEITKYEKKEFRAKLGEVKNKWEEVKALSKKLKEQGKDEETAQKLFEESEILFKITDELVGLSAEYVRERAIIVETIPLIIFALSLIFISFAFVFGRNISRNINKLLGYLKEISDGNFSQTLEGGGGEEIYQIISNANQIVISLSSLVDKIYDSAIKVYATAEGFLSTSAKLSNTTQKLSSEIAQIASAAEESSKATEEIERVALHSKDTAEKSMEASGEVVNLSYGVVEIMNQAYDSTFQLSKTLSSLVKEVRGIGNIVGIIKDIADQTNILAINASIEAARAGEQGKGFAVVASEIRKLAEGTIKSSNEISQKISSIQKEAQNTLDSMEGALKRLDDVKNFILRLKEVLDRILNSFSEVSKDMAQISSAVSEQASVSREIAKNTVNISNMSEDVSKEVRNVLSSAIRIISEIDELREKTLAFRTKNRDYFILDLAKTDHRVWVARVYGHILGLLKLDLSTIPDHTKCKLGRWYYSEGIKVFGKSPVFRELEDVHKKIHSLGIEILSSYERGDAKRAFELFPRLEETSQEVLRLLDELKKYRL